MKGKSKYSLKRRRSLKRSKRSTKRWRRRRQRRHKTRKIGGDIFSSNKTLKPAEDAKNLNNIKYQGRRKPLPSAVASQAQVAVAARNLNPKKVHAALLARSQNAPPSDPDYAVEYSSTPRES